MYRNYKVVCVTPAGRRRYMQYLIPQVLSSDLVDRYDIWINTMNKEDILFFKLLSEKCNKIHLVYQPDNLINGNLSINAFWRLCSEKDAIYIRLDDDIVWLESDFFQKILQFRVDNPNYFMIAPLVINNSLSTYLLQVCKKIKLNKYYSASCMHPTLWKDPRFALQLHEWFFNGYLKTNKYESLYCGSHTIAMNRFSINSLCWFGNQIDQIGNVNGDEEEYISVKRPSELGLCNCIVGDVLISHFAFFTQRKMLDSAHILEKYGDYLHDKWQKNESSIYLERIMQNTIQYVTDHPEEVEKLDIPYKKCQSKSLISRIINKIMNKMSFFSSSKFILE